VSPFSAPDEIPLREAFMMTRRYFRAAVVLAALLVSGLVALRVPASEGGWLPAGLTFSALTARQLRRRTSPESRRA
jgi:hypothetical protein